VTNKADKHRVLKKSPLVDKNTQEGSQVRNTKLFDQAKAKSNEKGGPPPAPKIKNRVSSGN
jgi:hypothetical protein